MKTTFGFEHKVFYFTIHSSNSLLPCWTCWKSALLYIYHRHINITKLPLSLPIFILLLPYETELIQKLVEDITNREAKASNLTLRYMMTFCQSIVQTLLNGFH